MNVERRGKIRCTLGSDIQVLAGRITDADLVWKIFDEKTQTNWVVPKNTAIVQWLDGET